MNSKKQSVKRDYTTTATGPCACATLYAIWMAGLVALPYILLADYSFKFVLVLQMTNALFKYPFIAIVVPITFVLHGFNNQKRLFDDSNT